MLKRSTVTPTPHSILLFLFLMSFSQLKAQKEITLRARDGNGKPIAFSSFTVTAFADSSFKLQKVADSFGVTKAMLANNAQYTVEISAVGYLQIAKGITVNDNTNSFAFTLKAEPKNIGSVTVKSKKPLMRQEDDKTIVDPENLALASTNAYEVIEKIPGVFMDQDGNIYLNGSTPSVIQINGKEMRISAEEVATILKSLPPNSIEKIEIIRTPSAKYEASGGGGIVNVVLKKGVKIGLTGSVNAGFRQGKLGNQFVGFNLSNNNDGKSQYVTINFNRGNNYDQLNTDRIFAVDSLLSQRAYTESPSRNIYLGYGLGWARSKKWTVDYDGRLSYNANESKTDNGSKVFKQSLNSLLSNNDNYIANDGKSFNFYQGLTTKYKIDSLGSEWTTDFSYNFYKSKTDQTYSSVFNNPINFRNDGFGQFESSNNFISAKTDAKWKLANNITLETGVGTILRFNKSETVFFKTLASTTVKDNFRTNKFDYNENINSVYVQGSKSFGDFVIKAGVRVENTNMNGQQIIPSDTNFKVQRTDLFPYVYLSKNIAKLFGFPLRGYLIYRRTISRPNYQQLNPFRRYVDQYLFEAGNPSLQPQFTQNVEFNISYEDFPVIAVGYKDTKDIFTNVTYQTDTSKTLAYRTYDNVGKNKEFYMRFAGGIPPGGKFFFYVVAEYNHNFYEGLYDNKPLSFKNGTWVMFSYVSLKLDPVTQIGINGFIRLNGLYQFYEQSNYGGMGMNISRQFLQKKLTVSLVASDVFFTSNNSFVFQQAAFTASGSRENDTRRIGLNLRYNFGARKKEEGQNPMNLESPEKAN